jgi:hypothetical protein
MHVSVLAPLTNQSGFGPAEQVDDIDAFDAGHPVVTQIDPTTLIGVVVTPSSTRSSPVVLPKPPEASARRPRRAESRSAC